MPATMPDLLVSQDLTMDTIPPSAVLTGIAPATLTTAGGAITIIGSNFSSGTVVTVGGQPYANVTMVSATRITCIAPARPGMWALRDPA